MNVTSSILFGINLFFQTPHLIDSLKSELKQKNDSVVQILLADLTWEYCYTNIDSATHYGISGLELAEQRGNPDDIARSKSMLAIVYDINGDVRKSAELYLEVATYYESQGNIGELSKAYNNLGVLFYYNGDYNKSEEYFLESLNIDEELEDSLGVANSLINLAAIANYNSNYTQSFEYLKRSEQLAIHFQNNTEVLTSVYQEMANTFGHTQAFDSAIFYLKKILSVYQQIQDRHSLLQGYNSLMHAFINLDENDSAIFYFKKAQQMAKTYDDLIIRKERNRLGAVIHARLNDFERAYRLQLAYMTANDSLTDKERVRTINELEEQYQSEKKEAEIARLQVEQQASRNERNVLLSIALLVLFLALFLYLLFRSRTKANRLISQSLAEKETLLKEIHHRVKNNLQVVSSLLNMQSRFIKDKEALGAVNEGQSRVESMALIHQKLYQENNLSGVNAKEYIEDLTEVLMQSYSTNQEISFAYEIDELTIDVDTIIPIGLILNELICNSLKHAFPNEDEGLITVKLVEKEELLQLEVKDNGVGTKLDESKETFGMVLIDSLAAKLKATLSVRNDRGTSTVMNIHKYKLV